jgi:hypothetical protein
MDTQVQGLERGRAMNQSTRLRIPTKDDPFFLANAGRMFMLLSGVEHHPPGCPINESLRLKIRKLYVEAHENGIDTIGTSECGLQERTYYSGEVNNGR